MKGMIDPTYEKILPEAEAQELRKLYLNTKCLCGHDLAKEPIVYYVPHRDGWTVAGEKERVWLYVKCPKCGYDMAVWKMGVPRE